MKLVSHEFEGHTLEAMFENGEAEYRATYSFEIDIDRKPYVGLDGVEIYDKKSNTYMLIDNVDETWYTGRVYDLICDYIFDEQIDAAEYQADMFRDRWSEDYD